ncbi:MAG TPA: hypothetical protein PJ986_18655 [Gammaproteobacteria bacterium]|nr:hypothetical protein [Gammaproteobacteria bacterium]
MGLPAISVATLGRHLRAVRGLLDGDTVEWSFDGQRRKLRFVNADLGLFNVEDPIEFHVAAMGPRTRALTARGHALFLKPEEEAFITGDFIRQCSFSGTAETLADRVKGMRDAGYTDVSFVVLPQYPEMVEDWARVRDLATTG